MLHRLIRAVAVFIISAVLVPIGAAGTVLASFLFLPLPATIPVPKPGIESRISQLFDINGQPLAEFRQYDTSIPVQPKDIPNVLKQAVVSSEDKRFYEHGGIDLRGSLRAFWADVRGQSYVQGGSTITQQYVKNAYTGRERTLARKIREAILASQIDRKVPKDQILFRYMQTIYLGEGNYGVGAASENYFRKPVSQLTLSEAAFLAGLIPAPTRYAPHNNAAGAEARRVAVLDMMLQQRRITPQEHDQAVAQKLFILSSFGPPRGPATIIFPPKQQETKFPYFVDYVRRYLTAKYGADAVFRGGLRIQTTLDPALQQLAEATVANQLKGTKPPLEMSLVAVEPPTGYVKALVGGRDFNAPAGQVNLALGHCPVQKEKGEASQETENRATETLCVDGGGTGRQPGSSFKPFTLAKAFEEGIPPERQYEGPSAYTYKNCTGNGCTVHNVEERESFGSISLRQATWHSVNTVFAQLIQQVGPKETAELAHRLGVTMIDPKRPHYFGITLGAEEVSPLDMAAGYSVFAARGMQTPATPVVKVLDAKGRTLEDNTKPEPHRVLQEAVADNVTDVLRGVISSGTGRAADIGRPAAGKTGTTENFGNAWFVGYTPTLATSVWMGYADAPRPLENIKGVGSVYGGTFPADTWHDFMSAALKDVPATEFNQPAPIKPIADELRRQERNGFEAGTRRVIGNTDSGGPYVARSVGAPTAVPPPAPTTTTEPPTTTTTLVKRGGGNPP